jgi:hypothetical protein
MKIVEKPPRNSAGFYGGGQGLSWAVEPGKEDNFTFTLLIYYIPRWNKNSCYLYRINLMKSKICRKVVE